MTDEVIVRHRYSNKNTPEIIIQASEHPQFEAWMPIETAPKGMKVLAGYWNECGMWRTITARYYLAGTLDSSEWNESEDGYADEGWYEESEAQDMLLPTDRPPTHWQPLPSSPTSAAP